MRGRRLPPEPAAAAPTAHHPQPSPGSGRQRQNPPMPEGQAQGQARRQGPLREEEEAPREARKAASQHREEGGRPVNARVRIAAAFIAALALLAAFSSAALAADEFDKFAIESASATLSDTQAGKHADMTIAVQLTRNGDDPYAKTRDGEIGGNSACPFDSQVGMSLVRVIEPISGVFDEPVYNMVPPKGTDIVARLGFIAVGWPVFVNLRVDPVDYSIIATAESVSAASGLSEATTTIWGVPSDHVHDIDRITPEEAVYGNPPSEPRQVTPGGPFLSNPTDCSTPRQVRVTARSYQLPDQPSTRIVDFPPITG